MRLTTAIFDLDGLLVDTEPQSHKIYNDILRPYGLSMDLATYAQHYSGGTEDRNMNLLIQQYRLPLSVEEGIVIEKEREKVYLAEGAPLKPGVRELLSWLSQRSTTIVLATSSTKARACKLLDDHGVLGYFGLQAFGFEVTHSKPAPDVFLLAAERAGAELSECVVFEDSEAGVRAGAAAGMRVVCVPDMRRPSPEVEALAWTVVESLEDAIALLDAEAS